MIKYLTILIIFSTFTGADRVDLQTARKGIPMSFPHLYNTSDNILYRNEMKKYEVNSERWLNLKDFPYEEWRSVVGYESRYMVSNYGRVKSLPTQRRKWPKILCQSNVNEHLVVLTYSDDGTRRQQYVHRLVATAFIPNPYNFPLINHRDENGFNNKVKNLEWCTAKYNTNYGTVRGRLSKAMEEYKRPVDRYTLDGKFVCSFSSISEAAPYQDDTTMHHIWECCNYKRLSSNGYTYRYQDDENPSFKEKRKYINVYLFKNGSLLSRFEGYENLAKEFNVKVGTMAQISKNHKPKILKDYDMLAIRNIKNNAKILYKDSSITQDTLKSILNI